jgi:hypothetical protein
MNWKSRLWEWNNYLNTWEVTYQNIQEVTYQGFV